MGDPAALPVFTLPCLACSPAVTLELPWPHVGPWSVSGLCVLLRCPLSGLCVLPALLHAFMLRQLLTMLSAPLHPSSQLVGKLMDGVRLEVPPRDQLPGFDTHAFQGLDAYVALMK